MLLFIVLVCSLLPLNEKSSLVLEIDNIEQAKGYVWVGVYDSEKSFLNKELATAVLGEAIKRVGSLSVEVKDIPYGTYAVAIFHDINGNGELDQGMFGVPKEPYAFSRPLKSKWRAPTFEDVKFQFKSPKQRLRLGLADWSW